MKIQTSRPLRIEVCGGIASGKTTLAKLLGQVGLHSVFENFQENPFWEDFYSNPGEFIFETELTFTLQHYNLIKKSLISSNLFVCDFSLILDLAYAELGLINPKLQSFMSVFEIIIDELKYPDVLVYLECEAETELERIRGRDREVEKSINLDFLTALNNSVIKQVNDMKEKTHIITLNSTRNNFAHDEEVRKEVSELITSTLSEMD